MDEFYKCEVVVADGGGLLLTKLLLISKMIRTKFLKVAEISWNWKNTIFLRKIQRFIVNNKSRKHLGKNTLNNNYKSSDLTENIGVYFLHFSVIKDFFNKIQKINYKRR